MASFDGASVLYFFVFEFVVVEMNDREGGVGAI